MPTLKKNPNLGGPSTCCRWDLNATIQGGYISQFKDDLKYITLQHYPQQSCGPISDQEWNISYFTKHSNVITLAQWNINGINLAKAAGKEVLLDEYNSASCGGSPGKSDTFAAALWSVDYSLQLAIYNYSAAYIHTREPGITYDIFNPPSANSSSWRTGPQYYSLLVLAEALRGANSKNGESVVVDLALPGSADGSLVAGYAIYDSMGKKPQKLVLFNFGVNSTSSKTASFTLPGGFGQEGKGGNVTVKYLTSPSLMNMSAITWAGQSVDGQGSLQGSLVENTIGCSSGCNVDVPGPGVALVTLVPVSTSSALGRVMMMTSLGGQMAGVFLVIGLVMLG